MGQKYSESIDRNYPETRLARFRTSSLQVAMEYLASNQGSIILPESFAESFVLQDTLTKIETLNESQVKCYLIYLKEARNSWLTELIEFLK
ncbi:hypothetical protein RS130_05855 [Paraglaciecola aquimarina]|uniref:LysR substrate-binding domain-containing protein n=1 Tax=Paraglaciecola aquimarina TaxID=1235557 RepID=A0ABU3SU30_9ALTE|nr:hypothetical protein [Paraglaciecola aquimarina]MDU0353515.1 hypothetical protein [Paraglaciecola aquimarina]